MNPNKNNANRITTKYVSDCQSSTLPMALKVKAYKLTKIPRSTSHHQVVEAI